MASVVKNAFPSVLSRENYYPKTASVAGAKGYWATIVSGYAKVAISSTANLLGVIGATWTNDANNTYMPIQEDEFGLWEMDVTGATLAQATHVGNAYDLSDGITLNLAATTYKVLTVLGITPDGRALVRVNMHFGSVGHI